MSTGLRIDDGLWQGGAQQLLEKLRPRTQVVMR